MEIIEREEWGASVPTFVPMKGPVGKLFLHHSVTEATFNAFADMKKVERIGAERFGRFSYNYVVHPPTGLVLEGAGFTIGAHTAGHNSTALSICTIGNFQTDFFGRMPQEAILWLFDELVRRGELKRDAFIRPHSAVKQTACPGLHIKNWIPEFIARVSEPDFDWFAMATLQDLKDALRQVQKESTYVMAVEGRQYLVDESIRLASYISDPAVLKKLAVMFGTKPGMVRSEFEAKFEVDDD